MNVRPANPEDLPELLRMGQAFHAATCYVDIVPLSLHSLADTLARLATHNDGVVVVVTVGNDKPIGMAAGMLSKHWFNDAHTIAQELFWWVDPEHRGSGAGAALIQALESWAENKGADTLSMASTANLKPEALARFYRRRGYIPQDIFYAKRMKHA